MSSANPTATTETLATTMRAVVYDRYGPPDVLHETRVSVPTIKPHQVLVKVHATTVNGGEVFGRAGRLRLITGRKFPKGTGIDFVGEITRIGTQVVGVTEGQRVWGVLPHEFKSAAEFLATEPEQFSVAPRNLTPVEASSLLAGGTTSLVALRDKARLRPGERLLVRGASGGVGSVAVQIGKLMGAHVTGLARTDSFEFVSSLGADELIDYRSTRPDQLPEFDVIMDCVGNQHAAFHRRLAPGGRMVSIAFDIDHVVGSLAYIAASSLKGSQRVHIFSGNPKREMFNELARYVEHGHLKPVVDTVHPLADLASAHRALEAGNVRGKHVIEVAGLDP